MAVKIIKRQYKDLYRPAETTNWLLGNVGDWQTLQLQFEVASEIIGTNSDTISINTDETQITLNSGQNWGSFGFDIKDQCVLIFRQTLTDSEGAETITEERIEFTIELILNEIVEYSGGSGFENLDFALIPTDRGTVRITNVKIFTEKEFEGTRLIYGHITNEEFDSPSLNSFIDGTTTEIGFVGLNNISTDVFQEMDLIGLQSGMSIRSSQVKKIQNPITDTNLQAIYTVNNASFRLDTSFNEVANVEFKALRVARTFPITLSTAVTEHQTITSVALVPIDTQNEGVFTNGVSIQMFVFNVAASFAQQYNFEVSFLVAASNDITASDTISIVLYKYESGATLNFKEKIVLQSYSNASSLIGQTLTYSGQRTIFLNTGESVSLAVEYFHDHPVANQGNRFVDLSSFTGTIEIPVLSDTVDFYKRYYDIEIEYLISSFFDSFENIEARIQPDYLFGEGSLTDNFDVRFFPKWNNPNTIVSNDLKDTRRLGNTGWFDENFNELDNDSKVESIIYRDTDGNVVQSLDFVKETIVEIRVSGVKNLNTDSRFSFGFMWIPQDETNFIELETQHYRNTFVSNGPYDKSFSLSATADPIIFVGAGVKGGSMDVKDIRFRNDTGDLVFTSVFIPNASFTSQFENFDETDRKYIIWVSVADSSASVRNFSNRTALLVDVNDLIKTITAAGPYPMTTRFIEHPFDEDQIGVEIYSGVTQDDILMRSRFNIDKGDDTLFQGITFAIEMENFDTGEIFQLETYSTDLSQSLIDSDGFQNFDVNEIRGFKLNEGNNKNFVKILVDEPNSTTDSKAYIAFYAFKIRYEDWIEKADVPNDFFDVTEDNDGNNNDWFDYINTTDSNFKIKFTIYISAIRASEFVVFRNPHSFEFKDYDQNPIISTAIRYIRDSDSSNINIGLDPETGNPLGVILKNELTRLEMDFTILDANTWIAGNVYAVVTIEIDKGEGIFEMRQLSSKWDRESDNPLTPVTGETKLKISIDVTLKILTSTCLVDPTLLKDAVRYRITGRVGCFENQDLIDDGGIYETAYEAAYE